MIDRVVGVDYRVVSAKNQTGTLTKTPTAAPLPAGTRNSVNSSAVDSAVIDRVVGIDY
ncbi:MAG: hypothetical protein LBB24_00270 [Rickettsiales bacterium]|nr:hypothetical protein [Rickettsiales bacterium]